mmetsp:Transcript_21476/g.52886  ORF Transcript_21476/g.52886 Transcript_21476/m.52886 type:complete len:274 (-) Transcript_21476:105-926(-)
MRQIAREPIPAQLLDNRPNLPPLPQPLRVQLEQHEVHLVRRERFPGALQRERVVALRVGFQHVDDRAAEAEARHGVVDCPDRDRDFGAGPGGGAGGCGVARGGECEALAHARGRVDVDVDGFAGFVGDSPVKRGEGRVGRENARETRRAPVHVGVEIEAVHANQRVPAFFSEIIRCDRLFVVMVAARVIERQALRPQALRVRQRRRAAEAELLGVPERVELPGLVSLVEADVEEGMVRGDPRVRVAVRGEEARGAAAGVAGVARGGECVADKG